MQATVMMAWEIPVKIYHSTAPQILAANRHVVSDSLHSLLCLQSLNSSFLRGTRLSDRFGGCLQPLVLANDAS